MKPNQLGNGLNYLSRGAQLLISPQLRWFVLVPVLINIVLFFITTTVLIQQFGSAMDWLLGGLPSWLSFLAWILWALFAAVILLVYGYSFSLITNLLAAPFYGVLAEKTEALISGTGPEPEPLSHMIPRTLRRELVKLWYFVSRGVLLTLAMLILSFIPAVNIIVPVIGFIWGAWSMTIQYADYAADNNRLSFTETRARLSKNRYTSLSMGGLVMLGTMIPLANIFIIPISVIGGTVYWCEELKHQSKSV